MNSQTKIFLGIGALILIIIGFSVSNGSDTKTAVTNSDSEAMAEAEMNSDDSTNVHPDTETDVVMTEEMMNDDENMDEGEMDEAPSAPLVAGVYTEYTPEAVTNSQAEFIVLNFSATWCPSCRTLDKNINENVTEIPDGVEIYKVDYDTNVELRKKYGITTQHTLVVVDTEGNMIKKWSGGSTLAGVVNQL